MSLIPLPLNGGFPARPAVENGVLQTSLGPTVTIIDSFDGTLNAGWTDETTEFASDTSNFVEGGAAVVTDTNASTANIESTSSGSLPAYFSKGQVLRQYVRPSTVGSGGSRYSLWFGWEGSNTGYTAQLQFDNDRARVIREDGDGTASEFADTSGIGMTSGDFVELEVDWRDGTNGGTDNDIVVTVSDYASASVLFTHTENDETWAGNAGFRLYFFGGVSSAPTTIDYMHTT
ncbi:hypothetical protein [Halomarina oriensis]|uniref:Uncharacterized protein n=1 Tax=Halomarina oriensis TaxID=671145 RepID=A0A6B0GRW6_9EURY|nr:hypothetical protein [Halomarina oriensis]MWG34815.1 hypothetical protein [Halomarina oriensis]